MNKRHYSDYVLCKRLLFEAKDYWLSLLGIFILGLLSTPLALLMPVPLKIAVDSIIGNEPLPGFLVYLIPANYLSSSSDILILVVFLLLFIGLVTHLRGLISWLAETYVGEKILLDFRSKIFRHLQDLSLTYHDTRGTSDSVYKIQYDAPCIRLFINYTLIPLVSSLIMLISMIWVTTNINIQLAFAAMAVCPVLFVLTNFSRKAVRQVWVDVKGHESSAMAVVQEVLSAIRTVKAFTKEESEHKRFLNSSNLNLQGQLKIAFTQGGFDSLIAMTIVAGEAAVLFLGIKQVEAGTLVLGELLMVMAYLAQLYQPLRNISKNISDLQSGLASADRVYTLLDENVDIFEKQDAIQCKKAKGNIKFENVNFSYNENSEQVLNNVSFSISQGSRIGLVGKTGSGKSTLISLLARFYDPTSGTIYIDGVNIKDYKLADLRNQISYVLQDTVLFSASIRDNILYANPDATEDEIIQASKAANAHEFIMELAHQYDTVVGERGMLVSGGQRQRISLARAFLKDSPIIVLDEPTSALDVQTEARILASMERLMVGRTTILITHRPQTLDNFDRKLVLKNGHIVNTSNPGQKLVEGNV